MRVIIKEKKTARINQSRYNLKIGYHRTRVTDSVGCTMETFGWVEIKNVPIAKNIYLKAYPNPANKYIIIEYKIDSSQPYFVKIIRLDNINQIVYQEELSIDNNKLELIVNDFDNGNYLISVWSEIDYFYNEINWRGDF